MRYEYAATADYMYWVDQNDESRPTTPCEPDGNGWDFLSAVVDGAERRGVVWYWRRVDRREQSDVDDD
jgi:hypothetical protein